MGFWKSLGNALGTGMKIGVGFAAFGWGAGLASMGLRTAQQWMGMDQGACASGRGSYCNRGMYLRQAQDRARMDRIEYNQAILNYRLARAGL